LIKAVGSGFFKASCGVQLSTGDGIELASAPVDEKGFFSVDFRMPDKVGQGELIVIARGTTGPECKASSGEEAKASYTVVEEDTFLIQWRTRAFIPTPGFQLDKIKKLRGRGKGDAVHFLLQWETLPDASRREVLATHGLHLISYAGGNAYVTSMRLSNLDTLLDVEGVRFAGPLRPEDKISPDLQAGYVGAWARADGNRVVITLGLHPDANLQEARAMVERLEGEIVALVPLGLFVTARFNLEKLNEIAAEDMVESIDVVSPRLEPLNDGVRAATNAIPLAAPPYNLTGAGVNVLVYDAGRVDADHPDFGTRVIENDGSPISAHATLVAGTLAGDGTNSDRLDSDGNPNGGTPRQWAGMAPGAQIRSFGISGSDVFDSAGDLFSDFTTAITHGVSLANMSLGRNVASNCFLCAELGDYTSTAIVIDDIVRGGIEGRRLIFFQAVGNERIGRRGCCGAMPDCAQFGSIPSPATSKNGIVVGAINRPSQALVRRTMAA
jgi:hypothetical protein